MSGAELATKSKEKPRGYSALLDLASAEFLDKVFDPDYDSEGYCLNIRGIFSKEEATQLEAIAQPIIDSINQELLRHLQIHQPGTFETIEKVISDFFSDLLQNQRAINQADQKCAELIGSETSEDASLVANQLKIILITIKTLFGDNFILPFQLKVFNPRIVDVSQDSKPRYSDKIYLQNELWLQIEKVQQLQATRVKETPSRKKRPLDKLFGRRTDLKRNKTTESTSRSDLSREQVNKVLDILIDAYVKHYLTDAYKSIFHIFFLTIRRQHSEFQEKEKQKVEAAIIELERQEYLDFIESNPASRVVTLDPIIGFPLLSKTMLFQKDRPEVAEVYQVTQKGEYLPYYSIEVALKDENHQRHWKEIIRVYHSAGSEKNAMTATAAAVIVDESPEVVQLLESIQKQDLLVS